MRNQLWQTVRCWQGAHNAIRSRRYGVIETAAGEFVAIHFRPWPKWLAWPELWPVGATYHARGSEDRCLLYYNQPRRCPNYLALKYVVTTGQTPYATFRAALTVLDAVAEVKQADALLCDAFNARLTDRFLKRQGWQPHKPQRWHRNYIKRFYGTYPENRLPLPAGAATAGTLGHR